MQYFPYDPDLNFIKHFTVRIKFKINNLS